MRGMTSSGGNSPTVGFYLDDVPMTAPAAAQNGKVVIDPTLYDLNRVEVLRGPQGTLYGVQPRGNQPAFNHRCRSLVSLSVTRSQSDRLTVKHWCWAAVRCLFGLLLVTYPIITGA